MQAGMKALSLLHEQAGCRRVLINLGLQLQLQQRYLPVIFQTPHQVLKVTDAFDSRAEITQIIIR
jgi:hypothetical protein